MNMYNLRNDFKNYYIKRNIIMPFDNYIFSVLSAKKADFISLF